MLFLGYESAVQYWRAVRAELVPFPLYSHAVVVANEDHLLKEIRESAPMLPIKDQFAPQLLVSQTKLIHRSEGIGYHLCSKTLPKGSFYQHTYGVSIAAPELSLLHAAKAVGSKGIVTLLELCCEFMGCYTLCEGTMRGFVECPPFVTRERLIEYIGNLPRGTRGGALLRRAVALAGENSRSPRETECFLAMTLPPEIGGFNLPRPTMNPPIPISEEDGVLSDDDHYLADLNWSDKNTIFEYDGDFDHSSPSRVARDKERRSVLASMGHTVIVAVKDSMSEDDSYLRKIAQVFRALDIPMPSFNSKEQAAQFKLRRVLFNPIHHFASPYITPIIPNREDAKNDWD